MIPVKTENKKKKETEKLPLIFFSTSVEFESWLKKNHKDSPGIWMKLAKKNSGIKSISYMEALDSALCYGWIDSQKKGYDENFWIQRFTPRKPSSIWSMINREKAMDLIESGRMKTSGLKAIEAAKKNGNWDSAYQPQKKMEPPDDFMEELSKNRAAKLFFESLDSANRYAILFRIANSKKEETRYKKIKQLVEMLSKKEKFH